MASLLDPEWITVPAGSFWMGGGRRANERPQHRVTLCVYRLARTVVRRAQYQAFLDATGRQPPDCWRQAPFVGDDLPACGVTWFDAVAYCQWLGEHRGEPIRLPTEAEWERAALADRQVAYPWGDGAPEDLPDYADRWRHGPEPVDAYPSRHPWGLAGMCENVHEWCSDWYAADYYAVSPRHDPRGPATGRRRSSRGGAWRHAVKVCPISHRSSIPPQSSYSDYGFRLAAGPAARSIRVRKESHGAAADPPGPGDRPSPSPPPLRPAPRR